MLEVNTESQERYFHDLMSKINNGENITLEFVKRARRIKKISTEQLIQLLEKMLLTTQKALEESGIDQLTKMLCRDKFYSIAEEIYNRIKYGEGQEGYKRPNFGVMVIDVNNFKAINDAYGHLIGDKAIATCASKILKMVRPTDVVGRIGGDEFAVLFIGLQGGESQSILKRFTSDLSGIPFNFIYKEHQVSIEINMAIGSVWVYENEILPPLTSLVHQADENMYQVKHSMKRQR